MFTKEKLLQDLAAMKIDPKGTILIHSSMKSIGQVEGGADTVLDALMEYMKDGLLILPTHTWSEVGYKKPVYDSRTEPACVGVLPNLFRQRPGVLRSLHPTHSVAAFGKEAADYVSGEEKSTSPCPREGCWGRLYDRDAEIMFLGCTMKSNTFIHGVEEWNHIPDRVSDWTQPITIVDAEGREYHVDMHRHDCHSCEDISAQYDKLEEPCRYLGVVRYGKFGDAKCIIGKARGMCDIASVFLKRNPDLFVDDKPVPKEYYESMNLSMN